MQCSGTCSFKNTGLLKLSLKSEVGQFYHRHLQYTVLVSAPWNEFGHEGWHFFALRKKAAAKMVGLQPTICFCENVPRNLKLFFSLVVVVIVLFCIFLFVFILFNKLYKVSKIFTAHVQSKEIYMYAQF